MTFSIRARGRIFGQKIIDVTNGLTINSLFSYQGIDVQGEAQNGNTIQLVPIANPTPPPGGIVVSSANVKSEPINAPATSVHLQQGVQYIHDGVPVSYNQETVSTVFLRSKSLSQFKVIKSRVPLFGATTENSFSLNKAVNISSDIPRIKPCTFYKRMEPRHLLPMRPTTSQAWFTQISMLGPSR